MTKNDLITRFNVTPKEAEQIPQELLAAFAAWIESEDVPFHQQAEVVEVYVREILPNQTPYTLETGRQAFLEKCAGNEEIMTRQLSHVRYAVDRMPDSFITLLETAGIGNSPSMLQRLATIGVEWSTAEAQTQHEQEQQEKAQDELKQIESERNTPQAQAQERINSIRNDPSHPYHRGDEKAVAEVAALYAVTAGTQPVVDPNIIPPLPEAPVSREKALAALSGTDAPGSWIWRGRNEE